jgi:hypothetical protein
VEHEKTPGDVHNDDVLRPPLRTFTVRTDTESSGQEDHEVTAHLVFDNASRGEGLVFRRYYDDSVRTEKVAEFQMGTWLWYKEKP